MKKLCVFLLAILMVFGISTAANAVNLAIDFYGGSTGLVQGDYDTGGLVTLTPGDFVNVDIIMQAVPDGNGLTIFGWTLATDPASMAISGLDTDFAFVFDLSISGGLITANAATSAEPDGDVLMVSFVLTCTGISGGPFSLLISEFGSSNNLLADGTDLASLFPTVLAEVNQVPIPGAVWLLGSGLLGLVGLRRRMAS
jgi:hypothetical protein